MCIYIWLYLIAHALQVPHPEDVLTMEELDELEAMEKASEAVAVDAVA